MHRKLNFYFYGETGEYDNYNPGYVCNSKYAPEILYLIAKNEPFALSEIEISRILDVEEGLVSEVISKLEFINAIETKENTYSLKFTVLLEDDVMEIEPYINNIGEVIGRKVIEKQDKLYAKASQLSCARESNYSYQRILYHVICDMIFDGTAFDFFTDRNTFCASKLQPGNRDYIIIAYEDSELVEKYSNGILCSSNNYSSSGFTFNSFGDSNGRRKDMFRFLNLTKKSIDLATPFKTVNVLYNKILDKKNKEFVYECGSLIRSMVGTGIKFSRLTEQQRLTAQFLKELEYISINEATGVIIVEVPVFYEDELNTVIKEISDCILESIYPIVKEVFEHFEVNVSKLTPVRHNVNIKETANELWHQIFGATNEYLAKVGFVTAPPYIEGQGRYFRSVTMPRA